MIQILTQNHPQILIHYRQNPIYLTYFANMRPLLEHTICSSVTEWHQQALSIISSLNKYTTDGDVQKTPVYIKQGDLMLVSSRKVIG